MSAKVVTCLSLGGGQGKTTTVFSLALRLSRLGIPTLLVDGDAQKNLTDLLEVEVGKTDPTLLEVISGQVKAEDAIYEVPGRDNLFIIPADRALGRAEQYLAESNNCAKVLGRRLDGIKGDFGAIVLDSPPKKGRITLTAVGASDAVIIPAEAGAKGVGSFTESWGMLVECKNDEVFSGVLAGILPFRGRLAGAVFTKEVSESLALMKQFMEDQGIPPELMAYPLVESVIWQKAWKFGQLPSEIDPSKIDLESPLDTLLENLSGIIPVLKEKLAKPEKIAIEIGVGL